MLRKNNAARLQETVKGVETMTRFALAVLALASGVYTYLGVRGLLDGTATFVFFAAIIYSAAVSVAIYAFWTFMLRFVPLVTSGVGQRVGAVPHHGGRLLHDHGDVVLAQRRGARRLGRAGAAPGGQSRGICRRRSTRRTAMRSPRNRCCPTCSAPPTASASSPMTSAIPAR